LIKEELPEGDFHVQEERRLAYVGMTRAMDKLYLTAADYYGEGKREKKLSPFIFEALGEKADKGAEEPKLIQQSLISYNNKESQVTHNGSPVTIDYLSFSRIDTFLICPLHYKLRYILGIPTPPSPAQSFGTSVHTALKKFYELDKKRNKDELLKALEKTWIKEGYKNKKHSEEALAKAKDYLSGYFDGQYNSEQQVVALEEPFSIPLKMKDKNLSIGGVMDRVDLLPDGSIEIIDYKTGSSVPSQKDVDKNMQLSIYALAATKIPHAPFVKTPDKVKLSLYYFEEQKKLTTTCTAKELEEVVKEIFKIRKEIEESDFVCSGHHLCQNDCEYSAFCKAE